MPTPPQGAGPRRCSVPACTVHFSGPRAVCIRAFLSNQHSCCSVSCYPHNSSDLAVIEGGSDEPLQNWIGPAGAHFARICLYLFGIAIYPLMIFLTICMIRPFFEEPLDRKGFSGSLLAVFIGTAILFGMCPEKFCHLTDLLGIGSMDSPYAA